MISQGATLPASRNLTSDGQLAPRWAVVCVESGHANLTASASPAARSKSPFTLRSEHEKQQCPPKIIINISRN
ncbi:hypothetical protein BLAT2472_60051 [Burkholderia latens]